MFPPPVTPRSGALEIRLSDSDGIHGSYGEAEERIDPMGPN
jgi:hypothetical protein